VFIETKPHSVPNFIGYSFGSYAKIFKRVFDIITSTETEVDPRGITDTPTDTITSLNPPTYTLINIFGEFTEIAWIDLYYFNADASSDDSESDDDTTSDTPDCLADGVYSNKVNSTSFCDDSSHGCVINVARSNTSYYNWRAFHPDIHMQTNVSGCGIDEYVLSYSSTEYDPVRIDGILIFDNFYEGEW
jgi:hypothetical protein